MDFHQRPQPQKQAASSGAGGWGATMRAAGGKTSFLQSGDLNTRSVQYSNNETIWLINSLVFTWYLNIGQFAIPIPDTGVRLMAYFCIWIRFSSNSSKTRPLCVWYWNGIYQTWS